MKRATSIFELNITLRDIQPPIWRRAWVATLWSAGSRLR